MTSKPPPRHDGTLRKVEVLGSLAAVLTAAVLLWNEVLKPGAPLAGVRAEVHQIEIHPGRSLRVYLDSHPGQLARFLAGARAQHLSANEIRAVLETRGVLGEFSLRAVGRVGQTLDVTQILYDARTEARVSPGSVELVTPEHYTTRATSYQSDRAVWLEQPRVRGSYFLEVDVIEPHGETLAKGRSRVFSVRNE